MKILLLGSQGQLGQELLLSLALVGDVKASKRADIDLTNHESIRSSINSYSPHIIINAAAYTAVDQAESEQQLAFDVNATAVSVIADECKKRNIWLIHYSTDYVFDGKKETPYTETDSPNPINVYGKSKLAGERAIYNSDCKHIIFRTTWIIGRNGKNFAKTILRLMHERDSLSVIDDQFGVPTSPDLISKVTRTVIDAIATPDYWPSGIYNLTPRGRTTWYEIAQTLLVYANQAQLSIRVNEKSLYPIKTNEYSTPAKRPENSLLNTQKLQQHLRFILPHWKDDFSNVITEIIKEIKTE